MACSAVVIALAKGVFMTIMPRAAAALRSTLSTPIPARPITLSRSAAATIFSVTLLERTARPVIVGDDIDELVARKIGFDVGVDPTPGEYIESQSAEFVGNKHL